MTESETGSYPQTDTCCAQTPDTLKESQTEMQRIGRECGKDNREKFVEKKKGGNKME